MGESVRALLRGRYRLDEVLRRGAGVTTHGGVDLRDGQPVVVKELRVGELSGWKEHELFEREARTLETLRHPGVPRFLDHFVQEEPPAAYLVMERVPGRSLDRQLAEGRPLPVAEVQRVVVELLHILDHLHGLAPPLLHRDVKPANLVVSEERVCLVDFGGVGRFLPWSPGGSTFVGTFGYLAPEQLGGECSPASDLYSLGATAAALLGGVEAPALPRDGLRIDLGRIPAARSPLRELLQRLLEPEPRRRLSSAAEALTLLARAQSLQPLEPAPRPPLRPPATATKASLLRARTPDAAQPPPMGAPTSPSPGGLVGAPLARPWRRRHLLRWSLLGLGGASLLAALTFEFLRWTLWDRVPALGDAAMVLCQAGLALTACGLAVRTRAGSRRKLLRLARRRGGRLHLLEAAQGAGLRSAQARELLEELVDEGLARRDQAVPGLYLLGR